jgi:hypothetical protein
MNWPATTEEMREAGYRQPAPPKDRKACTCGVVFYWWIIPNGRWMPFTVLEDGVLMPHHATCQNVKDFRVANAKHKARADKPEPVQETMF